MKYPRYTNEILCKLEAVYMETEVMKLQFMIRVKLAFGVK